MKHLSVDRIEGEIAVCQDDNEQIYQISLRDVDLPQTVLEGDIFLLTDDGKLIPDPEEKKRRMAENLKLLRQISKK